MVTAGLKHRLMLFAGADPRTDPQAPLPRKIADLDAARAEYRDSSGIVLVGWLRNQMHRLAGYAHRQFEPAITLVGVEIIDADDG